jgi:hypothetical protein
VSPADAAASAAAAPSSSSAPASPQDRKLCSSGSWRQHLPAISSISTSALLWGQSAEAHPIPQQQTDHQQQHQQQQRKLSQQGSSKRMSPGSWCGPAGLSWDWESLAAADDGWYDSAAGAGAGTAAGAAAIQHAGLLSHQHAAAGSDGFAAGASGGKDGGSSWQGKGGFSGDAVSQSSGVQQQQQQPIQWRSSWVHGKQRGTHSSSSSTGSLGMKALPQGPQSTNTGSSSVRAGLAPALAAAQASIELPVIVKRPSGVDSLVDALLDPEHSACSQTSTTAAAAAASAASGRVLASEASSSAVAGHRPTTGVKPPSQLRKGYSWHGNTSWFTSKAAALNSNAACGSSSGSGSTAAVSSSHPCSALARPQPQPQAQDQVVGDAWGGGLCDGWGDSLAAAESAVLDLDPLLSTRVSADVPGSALGSCSDPLQGLLEALNWSTDVQRYQQASGQQQHSGRPALITRRPSSSSEPCSPRRPRGRLPNVLSSPLLQSCRSAPVTPCAAQQPSVGSAAAAAKCGDAQAVVGSTCGRDYFNQSSSVLMHKGVGQSNSSSSSSGGGGSSGRRRQRLPRADVCRLLDLEEWVEEEADGVDSSRQVAGPGDKGVSGFNNQGLSRAAAAVSPASASLAAKRSGSPAGDRSSSSAKQVASAAADPAGPGSRLSTPSGSLSGSVMRPGSTWANRGPRSSDPGTASSSSRGVTGSKTPGVAQAGRSTRDLWGSVSGSARPAAPLAKPQSPPVGPISGVPGAAGSSSRSTTGVAGGSGQGLQTCTPTCSGGDEALLGLLGAEGAVAPSCTAEAAPVVVQQWQQLEKAWQRSWWV